MIATYGSKSLMALINPQAQESLWPAGRARPPAEVNGMRVLRHDRPGA